MFKEDVALLAALLLFIFAVFGYCYLSNELTIRCYETVKDKPAAEIKLLCR